MTNIKIANLIWGSVWVVVFALPAVLQYLLPSGESSHIHPEPLLLTYAVIAAFFLMFLVHNYVLIPWLYNRKRYVWHILAVVVLMLCFDTYLVTYGPDSQRNRLAARQRMERYEEEHNIKGDKQPCFPHRKGFPRPSTILNPTPPDMARMLMALMMLGINLGVDAMLKQRQQKTRLHQLEQQNLKHQLDYLKYQINPHFFMNTLNNIHALIDIDGEAAKRSLVELSKMMRYMLYEGNDAFVPLHREVAFVEHYIALMKLRYPDKVEISFKVPVTTDNVLVPPLLLGTFIENAFKHGVSYKADSFIYINLDVDEEAGQIRFDCVNSRHATSVMDEKGGIGLGNVRRRLDLLFENRYSLEVDDSNEQQYRISLVLPVTTSETCTPGLANEQNTRIAQVSQHPSRL